MSSRLVALALLVAAPSPGQESFLPLSEQFDPRAAGLAGAFVVLGDDLGAGRVNPAGLAHVPRFLEGTLGLGPFGLGKGGGLPLRGGAVFRYCAYTLGFLRDTVYEVRGDVEEEHTRLDAWSFFGSWRPTGRLTVGLSLSEAKLQSQTTLGLSRPSRSDFDFSRLDDTALSTTWGVAFDVTEADWVGATFRTREHWAAPAEDDPASTVALLAPARLALGYARDLIAFDVVTLRPTAQLEWRDYSDGLSSAGGRLGVEVSFPIIDVCWSGCGALAQLRFGWAFVPADALVHRGALPTSLERASGGAFGGSVAIDTFLPLRVDVGARELDGRLRWSAAFFLRYGVSFRDVLRR